VHAALQLSSSNGRTFSERIDAVRTERELSEIFEDFIAKVPMGTPLFGRLNPVRTGGPMQVSISFAEAQASVRPYPFPVTASIRREVFTRRGGMYFGIAHLLAYQYPARNRSVRHSMPANAPAATRRFKRLGQIVGDDAGADGDLLPPRSQDTVGETERAALALSDDQHQSILDPADRTGHEQAFERTQLYERVFAQADRLAGQPVPRAIVPTITLKSPKITRKLTTEWFARRVDERYRRCLAKAGVQPG
jgi:hypothetical protein